MAVRRERSANSVEDPGGQSRFPHFDTSRVVRWRTDELLPAELSVALFVRQAAERFGAKPIRLVAIKRQMTIVNAWNLLLLILCKHSGVSSPATVFAVSPVNTPSLP